jgi:undecaprenyl-diphosphatase
LAVILAVIAIGITDPTTHYILKTLFGRLRPCHVIDGLRLIAGCGGLYSMPSNHAVNSFAAAGILTYFYRRIWYLFLAVASIIGLSRVYLGKHYPSDIAVGALFGIVFAALVIMVAAGLLKKLSANGHFQVYEEAISRSRKWKNRKSAEN